MISTARAKTDPGGQNHYGQQVIHEIVLTEETIPQDHRELMSLIAGQGQITHSNSTLATPQVHSKSCADNFASNQCNLDETQVHQSVTGNYFPHRHNMLWSNHNSNCMSHATSFSGQFHPSACYQDQTRMNASYSIPTCMCGQNHCDMNPMPSSIDLHCHNCNSYLCNEHNVQNVGNRQSSHGYMCMTQHGSQMCNSNSVHKPPSLHISQVGIMQSNFTWTWSSAKWRIVNSSCSDTIDLTCDVNSAMCDVHVDLTQDATILPTANAPTANSHTNNRECVSLSLTVTNDLHTVSSYSNSNQSITNQEYIPPQHVSNTSSEDTQALVLAPVDSVLENSETSSQENDTEHSLTNNVVGERSFGAGTYKAKYYLKKIVLKRLPARH